MSTEDIQPAQDKNNPEPLSLEAELAKGFKEQNEQRSESDNSGAEDGQENDDGIRGQEQEHEQIEGDGGELSNEDELNNDEIEREAGDRDDGDEVHKSDGQESDGSHEGRGLLLESVSEELKSTFEYLPKEFKEHLENAEYDPETNNQILGLLKSQADAFIRKTQDVSELKKVIEPYKDTLAQAGITEAQKVQQYISWEQGILQNPKEGMIQLAKGLGFDLVKLIGGEQSEKPNGGDGGQGFDDPVNQKIDKLNKRFDDRDDAETRQTFSDAKNKIDMFAKATNDDGSLKYPHFSKIGPNLSQKMQVQGMTLEKAYQDVTEELGLSSQGSGQKPAGDGNNAPAKAKKSVKDKKKAATGVKSSSTAKHNRARPATMEDEIAEGLRKIRR